jgi:hypothetical protein
MLDWEARVYVKAGRSKRIFGGWDLKFGLSYEPSRPDTLVETEAHPPALLIWLGLWWVELTYKSSKTIQQERQRLHAV